MIGVVLAGGSASRLGGGDKGLRRVGGVPILDRVVAVLRTQCDALVVNANDELARFERLGLPVTADSIAGRPGPLAGVLAGLDWAAAHHPDARVVLTAPTDTPFLPADLVARLVAAWDGASVVCARSGGAAHPVVALWSVALRADLRAAILGEGLRKVRVFQARHATAYADWPKQPHDPFFNVNTLEDLAVADDIARRFDAAPGG